MTRDGFFTGLDIGTSSIKVLVAEHRDGEVNVIGVRPLLLFSLSSSPYHLFLDQELRYVRPAREP